MSPPLYSAIRYRKIHNKEPSLNYFRPTTSISKLSLTLGFVFALVCFLGSQASNRAGHQPLSVADQLWHSVAANSSHFGKRFKDVEGYAGDSPLDHPVDVFVGAVDWPMFSPPAANKAYCLFLKASFYPGFFQQPQARAPPLV